MQSNLLNVGIVSPPSDPPTIITLDCWGAYKLITSHD